MNRNPARPIWSGETKRPRNDSQFSVSYMPASRPAADFRTESAKLAAALGEEARGLPIYVCISGGVDSEVVCRSFLEAGVPFTPVVFRYNKHQRDDLASIRNFVTANGLRLKTIPFDEEKFLRDDLASWTTKYPISEPFVAFDMARIDRLDGYVVFGCGDIVLESKVGSIFSYELGSFFQPATFMSDENRPGCYQFFQGSAELMLAALNDPVFRRWIDLQPVMGFHDSRQFKAYALKKIWPDLELRRKWTGYERFAALYFEGQRRMHETLSSHGDQFHLPVNELLRQLQPSKLA